MPIIVFKILRLNKITNLVNLIRKDDNFKRSRRRNKEVRLYRRKTNSVGYAES